MSRRFVSEHRGEFPTKRLCDLVGVKRSTFYEWSTRPLSDHDVDDAWLANAIYDAVGLRMRTLPATPRVILEAIMDRDGISPA